MFWDNRSHVTTYIHFFYNEIERLFQLGSPEFQVHTYIEALSLPGVEYPFISLSFAYLKKIEWI